jgi:hypothetical protein
MRQWLKDLFSENSNVSMMRVLSIVALLIGGYLAIQGHDTSVPIFIISAFGGKAAQKYIEIKNS